MNQTIVWLCSDEVSFVTGHALPADGLIKYSLAAKLVCNAPLTSGLTTAQRIPRAGVARPVTRDEEDSETEDGTIEWLDRLVNFLAIDLP